MTGYIVSFFTSGQIFEWLSFARDYLIALGLVVGGVYVGFVLPTSSFIASIALPTKLLRVVGVTMIAVGAGLGAYTLGRSTGSADCRAEWEKKNLEAQIGRLKQENVAKAAAAKEAQDSLNQIADEKEMTDAAVDDYRVAVAKLESSLATCRRATADDDARMCKITGRSTGGCGGP